MISSEEFKFGVLYQVSLNLNIVVTYFESKKKAFAHALCLSPL
jgi:hypothetical protein